MTGLIFIGVDKCLCLDCNIIFSANSSQSSHQYNKSFLSDLATVTAIVRATIASVIAKLSSKFVIR